MKRNNIGVYWGRFNPPHYGHLRLIKKLVREVDVLIVAIGSAEDKNTKRNPFDGRERAQMMRAFLKEEGIRRVRVVAVRDGPGYASVVANLFSRCQPFDVLYTDKETII